MLRIGTMTVFSREPAMLAAIAFTILAALAGIALADSTSVADGRAIAERLCSRCHAIEGPGPSPLAMAPPFSGFERKWPVEDLAEAMAEGLVVGHGPMPAFVFTPEEIDALLAYLNSVQQ